MKLSAFTRLASLVLAFGFFFACSTSKSGLDSLISDSQYEEALSQIDTQLEENPAQPGLLFAKGKIHGLQAQQVQPVERSGFYTSMTQAFDEARDADADSEQSAEIRDLINKYWSQEHNAGTASFNSESADEEISTSEAHFNNAIIIKPTELSSYISLSTAQYSSGDISDAISTLNIAKNVTFKVPARIYENLGFLYLQDGNPEQSVFYYELANKDVSESKNIAFGLVNSYISADETGKAVELLRRLAENYPEDADIRNVYGTQLYRALEDLTRGLENAYSSKNSDQADKIRFELNTVSDQAETELKAAHELEEGNADFLESLAVFYNNMSANYMALYEVAPEDDKAELNDRASNYVDRAIEYYRKYQNMSPSDSEIRNTLNDLNRLKELRFTS